MRTGWQSAPRAAASAGQGRPRRKPAAGPPQARCRCADRKSPAIACRALADGTAGLGKRRLRKAACDRLPGACRPAPPTPWTQGRGRFCMRSPAGRLPPAPAGPCCLEGGVPTLAVPLPADAQAFRPSACRRRLRALAAAAGSLPQAVRHAQGLRICRGLAHASWRRHSRKVRCGAPPWAGRDGRAPRPPSPPPLCAARTPATLGKNAGTRMPARNGARDSAYLRPKNPARRQKAAACRGRPVDLRHPAGRSAPGTPPAKVHSDGGRDAGWNGRHRPCVIDREHAPDGGRAAVSAALPTLFHFHACAGLHMDMRPATTAAAVAAAAAAAAAAAPRTGRGGGGTESARASAGKDRQLAAAAGRGGGEGGEEYEG